MNTLTSYFAGSVRWNIPEWNGVFYTPRAGVKQYPQQYASVFNAAEFRPGSVPDKTNAVLTAFPEGFRFFIYLPPALLQGFWAAKNKQPILGYLNQFEDLPGRTKVFVISLPEAFTPAYLPGFERLLNVLPANFSYAADAKHPGFYDRGDNERDFEALLKDAGINRVITDTRKLFSVKKAGPAIIEMQKNHVDLPVRFTISGSEPLVRYIGTDVLNNEAYLREWALVFAAWIKDGKKPAIIFDSPVAGTIPALAEAFHSGLRQFLPLGPFPERPARRSTQRSLFE